MPKVVGLEIGRHEIVAVEMEGSARRYKVTKVAVMSYSDLHPDEAPELAERVAEQEQATAEADEEASGELTKLPTQSAVFAAHRNVGPASTSMSRSHHETVVAGPSSTPDSVIDTFGTSSTHAGKSTGPASTRSG